MAPLIEGLLFDPASGRTQRVAIAWDGAKRRLRLSAGDVEREIDPAEVTVAAAGWQGQSVQLTWRQREAVHALTLDRRASVEALAQAVPEGLSAALRSALGATRRAHGSGRRTLAVLSVLALMPLLALLLLFAFREALVDAVVRRLPASLDARLGSLVFEQVRGSGALVEDGAALEGVRAIGVRLVQALPEGSPAGFRFEVVRAPSINAFAAPGGLIVVHTGLLAEASGPEELAGVLAHEITHVTERHSLRQIVYQAGLVALLRLVVGSPEGAVEVLASATLDLTSLRFGRDQERQADRGGLGLLRRAGLPAEGLARFFERLARQGGAPPALLSSHPASEDRAASLRAEIARGGDWEKRPLDLDWTALQAAARQP